MSSNRISVLLVEDDTDSILLMNAHLNEACGDALNFQMECAERLDRTLELLKQEEYDVILLDLMLPDSQGLDTLKRVRERAQNTPIVVLTGLSDEDVALEALSHGAQDFLCKDRLDSRTLKRAISYAIERNRLIASWEGIIAGAADAMVIIDGDGIVRYANPAAEALFRRKASQMTGRPFGYPLAPGKTTTLNLSSEGGQERSAEMRVTQVDWKRYTAFLASIRDITDLRRLEQLKGEVRERQRVDRFKDEWLASLAKEVAYPLSVLRAANAKLGKEELPERQSKLLDLAHRSAERIAKLASEVVELSGFSACKARIVRRRVSVPRMVAEALQSFQLLDNRPGVSLEADVPAGLPAVNADADKVAQILGRLLGTALRRARSKVLIQARSVDGAPSGRPSRAIGVKTRHAVRITIEADGPGSEEDLAGCKDLVEQLQGKIWIESAPDGRARLHFTLPQYE